MSSPKGYSAAQIGLHWLVALLILAAWFTSDAMEEIAETRFEDGIAPDGLPPHAVLGLCVLLLAVVRLALRLRRGAPPPPETDPPIQRIAATWVHRLLYLLMIAVPTGGVLIWFAGAEALGDGHGAAGTLLFFLAIGHAAVAVWHHHVKKDGLMTRMTRPER